jgi:3-oxoacyl-[acyl-carrier protein] reductase
MIANYIECKLSEETMDLRDATVLVTGGSSGIGKAIARTLVDAGSKVAITGRDERRLSEAAHALNVLPIRADVSNESDVARTYEEVFKNFGHLDVLVNNAGKGIFKPLLDMQRADFEAVLATNMTGAMLMAREAARHFVSRKHGNIVNIGSTASHRGAPNGTAYYASKAALRSMTECWRSELRQHNIRVFLINPSEVVTGFAAAAGFQQKDNPTKLRGEDIAHAVKAVLQMDDRGFTTELTVFATNPKD